MADFAARTVADLYRLKYLTNLDGVVLHTSEIKDAGALRWGLKYALWALKPGGVLKLKDPGPKTFHSVLFTTPFSLVLQQAFKMLGEDVRLVHMDLDLFEARFERVSAPPGPGWTAGIVFSGSAGEVPALHKALDGFRAQPELSQAQGGQVIVCGPIAAKGAVEPYPEVEYLAYEADPGGRAFTSRKKNAIAAAARNPRLIILHARIVLQPGCLAAFPREFDVSTPRVEYHEDGKVVPYLDWLVSPVLDGDLIPRRFGSRFDYSRDRYLGQLNGQDRPYIDGGVLAASTKVYLETPISPVLAWGEGEDAEWCSRLHAAGRLVDLEPKALALSQTFKFPRNVVEQLALARSLLPARRAARFMIARVQAMGRRLGHANLRRREAL